jgi:hypothetical protein
VSKVCFLDMDGVLVNFVDGACRMLGRENPYGLKALGYNYATFDQIDAGHPQAFKFTGKEITVRCAHETFEGKTREKWSFAFGGGLEIKPLEKGAVSKLNALFGSKLKQALGATTAAPARPAPPWCCVPRTARSTAPRTEKK